MKGIRLERAVGGEAVASLEPQSRDPEAHDAFHGGALVTLLGVAMANAARSRTGFTREVVTVDLHVGFVAASSGRLVATARATGGGRSVCFCEAQVLDEHGSAAAQAMGTFRYRDAEGVRSLPE
ncbi:MAG: PaaI family thioesterase [Burkholderiales bacterium]|nr:PaaI family thioesterase [Burkholderiales bacterium]